MTFRIASIVEGFGEIKAVPRLIERWLQFRGYPKNQFEVLKPIRAAGVGALKARHTREGDLGVEHYIRIATLFESTPHAILIILDADKDCPKDLGPSLLTRARASLPAEFPVGVVVANREFEAWFIAAFASPLFRAGLLRNGFTLARRSLPAEDRPEQIADCKARVAELLSLPKYEPVIHQAQMTEFLPFTRGVSRRSRSFRKLLKELESLVRQAGSRGRSAQGGS